MEDFSDVLQSDVLVETVDSQEFEFDGFSVIRVNNHWEVQYEDQLGAEAIVIQPSDFDENGEFCFDIDGEKKVLLKDDFFAIEKFCVEQGLI